MKMVARSLYEQALAERDRLTDEVEYLRAQLTDTGIAFPVRWRLSPSERTLLRGLLCRRMLTRDAAMALLYSGRGGDEPGDKIIDVFIQRVRRKLKPDGLIIRTLYGEGYYLPPEMKTRARALLAAEQGASAAAAGAGEGAA